MSAKIKVRREKIKEIIFAKKFVKVSELSNLFGVSEETIRRDLDELENEGLIERRHGGARIKEDLIISPLAKRFNKNIEQKKKIAERAVVEIKEGNVIFLDGGSTTFHIAILLKNIKNITVVTNAINIAAELVNNPYINLFITPGKIRPDNQSIVGFETVKYIENYNIDILFLGIGGITIEKGLTTSDVFEAEVKKAMIKSSNKVIGVADSSKFGRITMVSFATLSDLDMLITDGTSNKEIVEAIARYVKIEIV